MFKARDAATRQRQISDIVCVFFTCYSPVLIYEIFVRIKSRSLIKANNVFPSFSFVYLALGKIYSWWSVRATFPARLERIDTAAKHVFLQKVITKKPNYNAQIRFESIKVAACHRAFLNTSRNFYGVQYIVAGWACWEMNACCFTSNGASDSTIVEL